jgi:hypothetical protein
MLDVYKTAIASEKTLPVYGSNSSREIMGGGAAEPGALKRASYSLPDTA